MMILLVITHLITGCLLTSTSTSASVVPNNTIKVADNDHLQYANTENTSSNKNVTGDENLHELSEIFLRIPATSVRRNSTFDPTVDLFIATTINSINSDTRTTEQNVGQMTLPPNVTGLCPEPGPENGLDPCKCTNNGGPQGGTINIDCPPEVSSQAILEDIIRRTTFFTFDVYRFPDNVITYFHFDSVSYAEAPYLEFLDLSGNGIEFIPQDAFTNPSLLTVHLARNIIYTLSQNSFSGLINAKLIDVSNNRLSDLQGNAFNIPNHQTSSVLQINLFNNSIRYIPTNAFGELIDVHVNLSFNQLMMLDVNVFQPIIVNSNYFAFFQADGNPILCDCNIFWIVIDPRIMECFDNFHCANRPETLYQLMPEDLPGCS
ncbi:uncharacterized protein LOC108667498 [Hyalella azteca]|uniref:Uncharacterized protein LOC108667498 n=1 Tax=Hyalella azteca TaxID=294128 RepID=A0A979FIC7_HYAAZ|nr:uncharacterized protein LOC108667498 [Hyalella azteca]